MNRLMYVCAIVVMLSAQYAFSADYSSQVKFTPEKNPLTVNADLTVIDDNGDKALVEGLWYKFNYAMTNNSPHVLKVQTFKFTVIGSKNGQVTRGIYQFDLAREITCPPQSACEAYDGIYVDKLPEDDDFVLDVTVEAEGMFEDAIDGKAVSFYRGTGTQVTQ